MVMTLTAPILSGRAEAWRRLCQEVVGSRAESFAATADRFGVRSLRVWMLPGAGGEVALIRIDVVCPDAALATFDTTFDRWLREQIQHLIGIDLAKLAEAERELVLEWEQEV